MASNPNSRWSLGFFISPGPKGQNGPGLIFVPAPLSLGMDQNYPQDRIKVPRFREEDGFYTSPERSKIMGKIRGRDTKPELAFRKALWHAGYRYRIDYRKLIGKPDIALKKHRTVIFIDGE